MSCFLEVLQKGKKDILKKVLILLGIFVLVNIVTNYRFLLKILYKGEEQVYDASEVNIGWKEYELKNVDTEVTVLQLLFSEEETADIRIQFTSEDFTNYEHFNASFEKSYKNCKDVFILFSLNTKANSIKISSNEPLEKIIVNPNIQYALNFRQTVFWFLIILFIIFIFLYHEKIDFNKKGQRIRNAFLFLFLTIIVIKLGIVKNGIEDYHIYNHEYVDSIINGSLEIEANVSEGLKNSENPYDTSNRRFNYIWDASYYQGKYYYYFGIYPNLVFGVPYKLITNHYFPVAVMCSIYAILGLLALLLLMKEIFKKYLPHIPYSVFAISYFYVAFGSKLFWCVSISWFYQLCCLAAFFHVIFGIYLVLFNSKGSHIRDGLGYYMLATAVLCRPTALLASILIVPKLISKWKKKDFKIKDFAILAATYGIVGIFTMYMNYIRFDSIFEFGIKYQLTTNNLFHNKLGLFKVLVGVLFYLFNPVRVSILPLHVEDGYISLPIVADYWVEGIAGGFFAMSILGVMLFFTPYFLKKIEEKELKIYVVLSEVLAVILIAVASGIGALIERYMLDFNYLLYTVTVILCLYFTKNEKSSTYFKFYSIFAFLSIFLNFFICIT